MRNKSLKIPAIIIAIGLVVAFSAHIITSICKKPVVTEQDFKYSVTYKLNGETKKLEGVYSCRFNGFSGGGSSATERIYKEEYTVDGVTTGSHSYLIAQKDGVELEIITLLNGACLMGDTENDSYEPSLADPYLEAVDGMGIAYDETQIVEMFGAEIVDWEYPEPIENSFVFAKIAGPNVTGMTAMAVVGILTLIASLFLVKKADGVTYSALDIIGILLNFAITFIALPVIYLAAALIQAYPTGPDWIYRAYLCLPQIIPFSIVASLSLRRKGFRKSGFFIQFLGIVILVILGILEYVL